MFDLGIQELILIFIVALIVFGPDKMPELARNIGRGMADLKNALGGMREQFDSEVKQVTEMSELKELKDITDPIALKEHLFKDDTLIKTEPSQEESPGTKGGISDAAAQTDKEPGVDAGASVKAKPGE